MSYIEGNTVRGRLIRFYEQFSNREIEILHKKLENAKDDNLILGILAPLSVLGFSEDIEKILEYSKHKNNRIRSLSSSILSKFKDKHIRKDAIAKIKKGMDLRNSIVQLSSNLKPMDDKIILKTIEKLKDLDELHSIGYGLIEADEINGKGRLVNSLKYVFYTSTCGICRTTILKNHLCRKDIKDKEWKLLKYDSNIETRDFIKEM